MNAINLLPYALLVIWLPVRALRWVGAARRVTPPGAPAPQKAPTERRRSGSGRLLLRLAAAPAEAVADRYSHRRALAVGMSVLLSALIAAAALAITLSVLAAGSSPGVLAVAVIAGLVVLFVDRRSLAVAARRGAARPRWVGVGRLLLALLLAAVVAAPIPAASVSAEADRLLVAEQDAARDAATESAREQLLQRPDLVERRQDIDAALATAQENERATADALTASQAALDAELAGTGGTGRPGAGPASRAAEQQLIAARAESEAARAAAVEAQRAATDQRAVLDAEIAAAAVRQAVDRTGDGPARGPVLLDVLSGSPAVLLAWAGLTLVLSLCDVVAVLRARRSIEPSARSDPARLRTVPASGTLRAVSGRAPRFPVSDGPTDRVAIPPVEAQTGHLALPPGPEVAAYRPGPPPVFARPQALEGQRVVPGAGPDPTPHAPETASDLIWLNAVEGTAGNYLLGLRVNRIGRSNDMDVVVPVETVSSHHCTITNEGHRLVLTAMETTNGTYVDRHRLRAGESVTVRDGDKIGLGTHVWLRVFVPQAATPNESMFGLHSAGASASGGRATNEDFYDSGERVVALADGVGGRPAGETAAKLAVRAMERARSAADLVGAVRAVNAELLGIGREDPRIGGLSSTLDAMVVSADGPVHWVNGVHVGDGIAMLQRPRHRELIFLTRAHTLASDLAAANPDPTSAAPSLHPQGDRLMRAVGLSEEISIDEWQEEAEEGQRYLLVSDGVLAALGEAGLRRAVADQRLEDPQKCASALVAAAIEQRAADNVTAVVADIVDLAARPRRPSPSEEPAPTSATPGHTSPDLIARDVAPSRGLARIEF